MKKSFTFSCLLLFISFTGFAQLKIGAPAGAPAASAILDISNTGAATNAKKGFLGPQVALSGTDDATTVPTPVAGLMVYNTNTSAAGATAVVAGYYYYNGTQWVQMVSSAAPASGNFYTADGTLTSARTVTMGANTLSFMGNNVGIGTASPAAPFHVVTNTGGGAVVNIDRYNSGGWNVLNFRKATGTEAAPTAQPVGLYSSIYTQPYGVGGFNSGTEISAYATQAQTATAGGSQLRFGTTANNSTGRVDALTIDQSGFVGIGTITPTYKLHIVGQSLGVDNTAAGTASFAELKSGPVGTPTTVRLQSNVGSSYVGNITNHDFQIYTNNTPRVTATAAGNVGIGTATPNAPLQFVNSGVNRKIVLWETANNDHQFYGFGVNGNTLRYQTDGTGTDHVFFAANSATTSVENMRIQGAGRVGIGTATASGTAFPNAKLHISDGSVSGATALFSTNMLITDGSNNGARIALENTAGTTGTGRIVSLQNEANRFHIGWQTNTGNSWTVQDAFVILPDGKIGFGVTTPIQPLQMASGAFVSAAGAWTNASDARLKTDIRNATYGLKEVMKLRPVFYNMKANVNDHQVGFIAQEVRKIIPEVVSGIEGDIKKGENLGLSYGNLVPVLTKAIQEQQAEIMELKNAHAAIKNQNEIMAAQLTDMKEMKIAMAAMQSELTKIALANKVIATSTVSK